MNIFNKNQILLKAKSKLYKGLFKDGYLFLKKEKYKFFLLNQSSFLKAEYFYLFGVFLANNGYYKKSIIYLKKSLLNPELNKSEILYYIIYSYLNLSNYKQVEYYFNKIAERSFNPFFIILSYYICTKNSLNLNISINSLKNILPDSSEQISDALSLSLYYILKNKFDKAYNIIKIYYDKYKDYFFYNLIYLKILFKILFLNKNYIKAIINLGKIYYLKGKYILAINFFRNALKKTITNYKDEIYFYLSICYQRLGLLNDSIIYFRKITSNSNFYNYALFNLSLLYYDLRNYKNANEIFSQINKDKIPTDLYNKWLEKINNIDKKIENSKILSNIIYTIPWLILIFSFLILIVFYIIVKY